MDLRVNGGVSQRMLPRSQWREPLRDRVGAEQVHPCTTQTGGSDCGPVGQRSAPSGSRRAATGVRNNRRVCSETMEDHDRRFRHRWPLTWRSSHAFTVLNTTQFHVRRPDTDLARRERGSNPSPPPHTNPGHEPAGRFHWPTPFRSPRRVFGHFPRSARISARKARGVT
jgi:hypothetical protein